VLGARPAERGGERGSGPDCRPTRGAAVDRVTTASNSRARRRQVPVEEAGDRAGGVWLG
jgi:hypothetical protein